jgi:hypothetical protein
MSSSQASQHSTRMFARVLGPFLVISCVTAVVRSPGMRALVTDFGANPVWPWVTGAFMLVGGLVIVALQQCWRGAESHRFCIGLASGAAWALSAGVPNGLHVDGELGARGECAVAHGLRLLRVDRALSDLRRLDARTNSTDLASSKLYHRSAACSVRIPGSANVR